MGHIFMNANRNKRSVVIDLKQEAGRAACPGGSRNSPMSSSTTIRPQAMARLRLSYEEVRAVNPKILYVGAFGYSQRGPYAAKAGVRRPDPGRDRSALVVEAGRRRDAAYVPATLADRSVGLHIVNAVCGSALPGARRAARDSASTCDVREPAADGDGRAHGRLHLPAARSGEPGYARMLAKERRPTRPRTATSACWSTTTSSGARSSS
jgi:hypothetical protein